jgi:hypothetical protein
MKITQRLRKQVKEYEREGFHVVSIENRAGSHKLLTFAEFPEPQIVTACQSDWRAFKNNIARFKRLAKQHEERKNESNTGVQLP